MLTLAFANQKGGVGKSTTVFHLAREAAKRSLRALVIDADPQGNISSALSSDELMDMQAGLADALSNRTQTSLDEVIIPSVWDSVLLAPTTGDTLAFVRDDLVVAGPGRESRLKTELSKVQEHFDLCLIDCPPSVDQLTINALSAADGVVIVTQAKMWSMSGLGRLLDTIKSVRRYYNPRLEVRGVVTNMYEGSTLSANHWQDELKTAAEAWNLTQFDPPIPKRVVLADTVEAALGLDQWPSGNTTDLQAIYTHYFDELVEGAER